MIDIILRRASSIQTQILKLLFTGDELIHRPDKEIIHTHSMLFYDTVFCKSFPKYICGILAKQSFRILTVANCSTSSYWCQLFLWQMEFQFQSSNEVSHISTLCAIVSMKFIQHDKSQHRF